jgi:flagellar basal body P-ring protein FlgI
MQLLKKEHLDALKVLEITIDENSEEHVIIEERQGSFLRSAKKELFDIKVTDSKNEFMSYNLIEDC